MGARIVVFSAPALGFCIALAIGFFGVPKAHWFFSPLSFVFTLLPSAICLVLVLRSVRSSKRNTSFLYSQVLWGAIPGFITISVLQTAFTTFAFGGLVAKDVAPVFLQLLQVNSSDVNVFKEQQKAFTETFKQALTPQRLVLGEIFIVAVGRCAIRETGKLILGLRVLSEINAGVVPRANVILAAFCASTVGLMGAPAIVQGIFTSARNFSFRPFCRDMLMSYLMFSVEIGTACYLGLSVSKRAILGINSSDRVALALAVFLSYISNRGLHVLMLVRSGCKDMTLPRPAFLAEAGWQITTLIVLGFLCRRTYLRVAPARHSRVMSEPPSF